MTHPLLNPANRPIAVLGAIMSVLTNRGPLKASELKAMLNEFAAPDLVDDALERLLLDKAILQTTPRGTLDHQYIMASDRPAPAPAYSFRHIMPIFTGYPEFIVERARDRKLVAWCPNAAAAKLIAEALNQP